MIDDADESVPGDDDSDDDGDGDGVLVIVGRSNGDSGARMGRLFDGVGRSYTAENGRGRGFSCCSYCSGEDVLGASFFSECLAEVEGTKDPMTL